MSRPIIEDRDRYPDFELDTLANMPVFGGVPADALSFILARTKRVQVPRGKCYFREGQLGDTMYVLLQGYVEVCRWPNGHRDVLGRLGPGDCFGEMALLDLYPRSASVEAIEDSAALGITHGLLYDLYAHSPEPFTIVMMNLARELSRRLRAADEQRAQLSGNWSGVIRSASAEHRLPYI